MHGGYSENQAAALSPNCNIAADAPCLRHILILKAPTSPTNEVQMTHEIKFPESGNIVEVRLSGVLSLDTFRDLHAELYFGGKWRTGMNVLVIIAHGSDPTAIDAKVLRTGFREEVERLLDIRGPEFKTAWVAEDTHVEPLLLQWQSMPFVKGTYDFEVFRDLGKARAWLETFASDWPEFYSPKQSAGRA